MVYGERDEKGVGKSSSGLLQCIVTKVSCRCRKITSVDFQIEIWARDFKDSKEC